MSDCPHEDITVNIRVMGWEMYSWSPQEGLVWADAAGKSEIVPKSGICSQCGKRVFRDFERNKI